MAFLTAYPVNAAIQRSNETCRSAQVLVTAGIVAKGRPKLDTGRPKISLLLQAFLLIATFAARTRSQQINVTLTALIAQERQGELSLGAGTYFVESEAAAITKDLIIVGEGESSTVDLSQLPAPPTGSRERPILVQTNVTFQLRSLVLRLPTLTPVLYNAPTTVLSHVIAVEPLARVLLDNVTIVLSECTQVVNMITTFCSRLSWKYNTTGLQILDGTFLYERANMALSPADDTSGSREAASAGAVLTSSRVTCSGGLPPPWPCSATFISSVSELQTRTRQLLLNTTETLVLSIAANLTLNPVTWQPLDLGDVSLLLYGNPDQVTVVHFGLINGAISTPNYRKYDAAIYAKNLVFRGLPYPPTITGPLDFFALWMHPFKMSRDYQPGMVKTVQLYLESCTIVLGSQEHSYMQLALMDKSSLPNLFLSKRVTVVNTTVLNVDDLVDATSVVRCASCLVVKAPNGSVEYNMTWPMGGLAPATILALGFNRLAVTLVADGPEIAPFLANASSKTVMARSSVNGDVFMSAVQTPRNPANSSFGPRYLVDDDTYILGAPVIQTGKFTFWDHKGVTGELYVPKGRVLVLDSIVIYNMAPGGALPYGQGFGTSDTVERLMAYASGWDPSGDSQEVPAPGVWDAMVNLTLPLWYFKRERSFSSLTSVAIELRRCTLVVPKAEFDVIMYLLWRAGKLASALDRAPPGSNSTSHLLYSASTGNRRRLVDGDLQPPSSTVVVPGKPDAQLTLFASSASVSWYSNDTIYLSSATYWGWIGTNVAITNMLPPGAPTPALQYSVSYDPTGYPPPSPLPPPSPFPPPSPPSPSPPPLLPPLPSTPPHLTSPPVGSDLDPSAGPLQPPQLSATITLSPSSDGGSSAAVGIAVGVSVGAFGACVAMVAFILIRRRRTRRAAEAKQGFSARSAFGDLTTGAVGGFMQPWEYISRDDSEKFPAGAGRDGRRPRVVDLGSQTAGKGDGGDTLAPVTGGTLTTATNPELLPTSGVFPTSNSGGSSGPTQQIAPHDQALERLQLQAAAATTPAETMAMLAAAAAGGNLGGGDGPPTGSYYSVGSGNPIAAPAAGFPGIPQLQLVIVEDEKMFVQPVQGQAADAGDAAVNGGAGGTAVHLAKSNSDGRSWALGGPAAGGVDEGSRRGISLNLGGKSLLQTMDIESALQAYSSRSGTHISETASLSNRTQQQDASPSPAPARSGADLAAAISSLQAELSGRQEQLRITTVLGKGSFGVVYLGTWRGLRVAVKTLVVHDALLGTEGRRRQRAILEAAISTSLHHPNVVSTYAFEVKPLGVVASPPGTQGLSVSSQANGTTDTNGTGGGMLCERSAWESAGDVYKLYIIQEYCDVGTLRDALTNGVVGSVSAGGAAALCALTLALDVACGMCHIHSKNIVHGDLSSANILLTSFKSTPVLGNLCSGSPNVFGSLADAMAVGRTTGARSLASQVSRLRGLWRPPVVAKVADFGLSVRMGEGQTHASNKFQGTPLYSAPEVLMRGHLTKASDVFSYGVMLLEFYYGSHIADVKARRGAGLPDSPDTASIAGGRFCVAIPASCPLHLRNLMVACISPEPCTRPTFEQVVDSLVEMLLAEHNALQQRDSLLRQQACDSSPEAAAGQVDRLRLLGPAGAGRPDAILEMPDGGE